AIVLRALASGDAAGGLSITTRDEDKERMSRPHRSNLPSISRSNSADRVFQRNGRRSWMKFDRRLGAFIASACVLSGWGGTETQPAMETLEKGEEIPRLRASVTDDLKKHTDGVETLAARLAPLFEGDGPPDAAKLRTELLGVKRPPEVIQAFVFSPVDRLFVLSPDGVALESDDTKPQDGERNRVSASPGPEAALGSGRR